MRRWSIGFAVALLWAVAIVLSRSQSAVLLADTDTRDILIGIEQRQSPLSWFASDWPLHNHFYRPVVTQTFEADLKLHGRDSEGFALTNALLCGFCLLALFWMLREVTGHVALTTGATSLFGLWHFFSSKPPWADATAYALIAVAALATVAALVVRGRQVGSGFLATAAGVMLVFEIAGLEQFRGGMIDWIPGRTASTMTLFCLLGMGFYARYERLSAARSEPEPGPLDPPATRGSEIAASLKWPWVWAFAACVCVALALGSYEQAVMLPACLFGVALAMRLKHYRVRWAWQAAFWGLLFGYLALRQQVIPPGISTYQDQQLRSGLSAILTALEYVVPGTPNIYALYTGLDLGLNSVLLSQSMDIMVVAANIALLIGLWKWGRVRFQRRERGMAVALLFGLLCSFVAFLPMAWLKQFPAYNHYHYWSLATRSVYVMGLLMLWGEWVISACSRPALQAPPRPAPAPGSLPHP